MQLDDHLASRFAARCLSALAILAVVLIGTPELLAQDADELPEGVTYRKLASGVMYSILPETQKQESFSRHDLLGLLKRDSTIGQRPWSPSILAKDVRYTHDVWGLEFVFKPMRYVLVDIPQNSGKMIQKPIWYQVFYVVNRGTEPVRFIPRFVLHDKEQDLYYNDRVIPVANEPIRKREDPNRKLLNTVQLSQMEIPPSTDADVEVWGVVTWEDVDPRCDRFAVYIQGLTNAYKGFDVQENGETVRKYTRKTLLLNFWRPGDEFFTDEREIRFGDPTDLDYEWVYK